MHIIHVKSQISLLSSVLRKHLEKLMIRPTKFYWVRAPIVNGVLTKRDLAAARGVLVALEKLGGAFQNLRELGSVLQRVGQYVARYIILMKQAIQVSDRIL